jgi:dUTP pyrophosphatase
MRITVKRKHKDVAIPQYATEGSAGFDLVADSFMTLYKGEKLIPLDEVMKHSLEQNYITLRQGERVLIGTGLFVSFPAGYELQIRDRSGIALKKGLKVMNSPGTIDSDYRGEIGVIIGNLSGSLIRINLGERIAQAVLTTYVKAEFHEEDTLDETHRLGGFGSTGI